MGTGTFYLHEGGLIIRGATGLQAMLYGFPQVAARNGLWMIANAVYRAGGYHLAALDTRTRTQINDVVCCADGVFVMFNHNQGIALFLQFLQGAQKNLVIPGEKTNGGFIEDVANAL